MRRRYYVVAIIIINVLVRFMSARAPTPPGQYINVTMNPAPRNQEVTCENSIFRNSPDLTIRVCTGSSS
jgi:hypothetical protein